jgi:hypothetical protein
MLEKFNHVLSIGEFASMEQWPDRQVLLLHFPPVTAPEKWCSMKRIFQLPNTAA